MKKEINYFNEALLLATRICNWEEKTDSDLPINYKKYELSKEQIDLEHQDLISFYNNIRREGRSVLNEFSEIEIFFKNYRNEKIPEILYFLTYSRLQKTIKNYSTDELLSVIKSEFIKNMQTLGYDLSPKFHLHEIDNLKLFNEQQRYLIYKLLHNINHTFDQLYQFILLMEQVIKNQEYLILSRLDEVYSEMGTEKLISEELESTIDSLSKNHTIVDVEYTLFIQFPQLLGHSLFLEGELTKGFCYFGLVPCLLEGQPKSVEEKKRI